MKEIHIVYSTDTKYIFYVYTSIYSVIKAGKIDRIYSFYILLDFEINNRDIIEAFKRLQSEHKNVRIEFFNICKYTENLNFSSSNHISKATYYRAFIPLIYENIDKIIYIDADTIVRHDVAELYDLDVSNYLISAAPEPIEYLCTKYTNFYYYFEYLKIIFNKFDLYTNYFNAGVLVMNLKALRSFLFTKKFIDIYSKIKKPIFTDQDVLNILFSLEHVKKMDIKWNLLANIKYDQDRYELGLPTDYKNLYDIVYRDPFILHYAGPLKPWLNPCLPYANEFWCIARETPFYENILYRMMYR